MSEVSFGVFIGTMLVLDWGDSGVGFSIWTYHGGVGGLSFAAVPLEMFGYLTISALGFAITLVVVAILSILRAVVLVTVVTAILILVVESPGCFALLSEYCIDGFKVFFVDSGWGIFGVLGLYF